MRSTSEQILLLLKSKGPASTRSLAEQLGVSRQGALQQPLVGRGDEKKGTNGFHGVSGGAVVVWGWAAQVAGPSQRALSWPRVGAARAIAGRWPLMR